MWPAVLVICLVVLLCVLCRRLAPAAYDPDARLLQVLQRKLHLLISQMQRDVATRDDARLQRLVYRWDGVLTESNAGAGSTADKRHVSLCTRGVDGKLQDENDGTFVALHELAHVCSQTSHHTPEFDANFKWLLQAAVAAGLYVPRDYNSTPISYCDSTISSTPLS